jgi:hypothetical protein
LVACLVLLVHVISVGFACDVENVVCANSSEEPVRYSGRLFTWDGRPLATRFQLRAQSRLHDGDPPVFATDRGGRFCVEAAPEDAPPYVVPLEIRTDAPVDPRFRGAANYHRLEQAQSADGIEPGPGPVFLLEEEYGRLALEVGPVTWAEASGDWARADDFPFRCEEAGRLSEWYRDESLDRSWQFFLLLGLPVGSVMLLGAAGWRRPSGKARPVTLAAGLLGVALCALLFVVLWDYKQDPRDEPVNRPGWLQVPVANMRDLPEFEPRSFAHALRRSILSQGYPERQLVGLTCGPLRSCDITLVNPGFPGSRFTDRFTFERTPVPTCWRFHSEVRVNRPARPKTLQRGSFTGVPPLVNPICPAPPA